jgi:lipopolysaccharide biosynthesis glycosyltransferase
LTDGVGGHEIAIAVTIDDRYVPHFATCIASLAASRGSEHIRFFLLRGPGLSAAAIESLRDFANDHGLELETIEISDAADASLPPTSHMFSPLVWYRLLLPDLLPDLDRLLFLDADTLVLQSLAPLFGLDLGGDLLAAVGTAGPSADHMQALGLDSEQPYLNAGVMLMNLAAMRAEDFGKRALALGHERSDIFTFNDQDALNVLANGRWRPLHPRWNAMSHLWLRPGLVDPAFSTLELEVARLSPAVVHFEGAQTVKPWFYRSAHPLRNLYREYRAQTPWPMAALEGRTARARLLRILPLRWQYALARARARMAANL